MPQTPPEHIYARPVCNPSADVSTLNGADTPEIYVRLRYWTISGIHTGDLPATLTLGASNKHRPAIMYAKAPHAQLARTDFKQEIAHGLTKETGPFSLSKKALDSVR